MQITPSTAGKLFSAPYFQCRPIARTEDIDALFELRYQVYCIECGFLAPEDYPDGKETDEYDAVSFHFAGYHRNGTMAGGVRLVHPQGKIAFPFLKHCHALFPNLILPDAQHAAEISRLVVSKQFRRRTDDTLFGVPADQVDHAASCLEKRRKTEPELVLGLYRAMYQQSKQNGITHWYAAMEKSLARLLSRFSFTFQPIGPEVDYYGPVAPYIASLAQLEQTVRTNQPALYDWFQQKIA